MTKQKKIDIQNVFYNDFFHNHDEKDLVIPNKEDEFLFKTAYKKTIQDPTEVKQIIIGGEPFKTKFSCPLDCYNKKGIAWFCKYCLKYFQTRKTYLLHKKICNKLPPGDEIYRDGSLSVFRIDGNISQKYCKSLCLIGKTLIEDKTLYNDVSPFLFYVLVLFKEKKYFLIGYFSKEKSSEKNNLSCILIFPSFQKKGHGLFLISLSYLLCSIKGTCGSPEKPLSEDGERSYKKYWTFLMLNFLKKKFFNGNSVSLKETISQSGLLFEDVKEVLEQMNIVEWTIDGPRISFEKIKKLEEKQKPFLLAKRENLKDISFVLKTNI